jgi:hypothetical protein
MPVSSRFLIDYPLGTEAPDIDGDILKVVQGIEALAAQFGQGTLAARPVSTPGSPGKQGRIYVVTSGAELGQIHYDYGTGWLWLNNIPSIGADSITATELAANSVGNSELAADSVGDSELADNVVAAHHLVNALKPSTGAGGGTEALRALGTAANNAAAGNDARLSDQRTPADGSVSTGKIADDAVVATKIVDNITMHGTIGATGNFVAMSGSTTSQVIIGESGGGSAVIRFGGAGSDYWHRQSAGVLATGGIIQSQGMTVHRHPYGSQRHIEGNKLVLNANNNESIYIGIGFTDAFAAPPNIVTDTQDLPMNDGYRDPQARDVSTGGFTFEFRNGTGGGANCTGVWIAEGPD